MADYSKFVTDGVSFNLPIAQAADAVGRKVGPAISAAGKAVGLAPAPGEDNDAYAKNYADTLSAGN